VRLRGILPLALVIAVGPFKAAASDSGHAGPAPVQEPPPPLPVIKGAPDLSDLVRDLSLAQTRAVVGDITARKDIQAREREIDAFIEALPPDDWKQPKNRRAAATYLLAGGSPRLLRKLFDEQILADDGAPLITASLAHAEGRKEDAATAFQSVDPNIYPAPLAGHIALVRGGLVSASDKTKAAALLALARLLVPESLVEEAALRRELAVLDLTENIERYVRLARRYVEKYSKSPFSKNFWDTLTASTLANALSLPMARLASLEDVFAYAQAATRFELHAAIARRALLEARQDLAASEILKADACAESEQAKARLRLYRFAMGAESGALENELAKVEKFDRSSLTPREQELLRIVNAALKRLRDAADFAHAGAETPLAKEEAEEAPSVLTSALHTLADADATLKKAIKK
jgi:chemotaxis protein MotC